MIRFAWFRLAMKLLGLALLGWSIPTAVQMALQGLFFWNQSGAAPLIYSLGCVPFVLQVALGVYLLFDGRWVARQCLHDIDTVCPCCAYDISAVAADLCPECGFRFRLPAPPPPREGISS